MIFIINFINRYSSSLVCILIIITIFSIGLLIKRLIQKYIDSKDLKDNVDSKTENIK